MSDSLELTRHAALSEDRVYRYQLSRSWGGGPLVTFVMLNPSTADEHTEDPTLRRCMRFAQEWGFGGVRLVNLYALRATNPHDLWRAVDPVGPENNRYLSEAAAQAGTLVAAWGIHAKANRVAEVRALPGFETLTSLRTTRDGHPGHPLYLPKSLTPSPWPKPE